MENENEEKSTHTEIASKDRQEDFIIRFFSLSLSSSHVSENVRKRKITLWLHRSRFRGGKLVSPVFPLKHSPKNMRKLILLNFRRDREKYNSAQSCFFCAHKHRRERTVLKGVGGGWRLGVDVIYILEMQFSSSVNFEQDLGRSLMMGDF